MENLSISNDEIQQNIAHLNEQLRVERINIHLLQVQCKDLQARVRILREEIVIFWPQNRPWR
ncbi:hypothetical protein Mgra_00004593 [Meloidogyne graminicola]|uniref:Uncharacterized protein n=1 Tax=Meloidogyne graminicola TaxID=189291 RepID=A0A8S9ZRY8_9BILA|nr:hypothetical protein Mgra_00004593 [Meloidogyne graminicola]